MHPRDRALLRSTVVRLTLRSFWVQGTVVRTQQSTVRLRQLLVLILLVPRASLNLHSYRNSNTKAPLFDKIGKTLSFVGKIPEN